MKRLLLSCLALVALGGSFAQAQETVFEAPVRLTAGGELINKDGGILYPSPVLMDIDGDGKTELVIGDLWGVLRVYESSDSADGLKWQAATKLQVEGKDLKVPNW